jgi:ABC-type lipoprotein release transport system permease subunit
LAYRCSIWRRQFGPALDQTIFGLERHDPLVMSGAAIRALAAIVAALVPARAAALVDPLLVLRHE